MEQTHHPRIPPALGHRIEVRLESLTRLQGESAEIAGKLAADLSSVREIVAQHRAYLADDQKPLS